MAYGLPQGGQRIVVADRASRITGMEIAIPSLRANPDIAPAPNGWNREFGLGQLAGYQILGSITAWDCNKTVPGQLYLSQATDAGYGYGGVVWACPAPPYTVTVKMSSANFVVSASANTQQPGLILSTATPSTSNQKSIWFGVSGSGTAETQLSALGTNSLTTPGVGMHPPVWLRAVVTSSSSVAGQFSFDGLMFTTIVSGVNLGWTVGTMGVVARASANAAYQVTYEYMRVTTP